MTAAPSIPTADWLEELDRLTARDGGVSLHEHVIGVAARRLGASGGAIWRESPDARLEVLAQLGLGSEPIDRIHSSWSGHETILRQVLDSGRPQTVSARLDQFHNDAEQTDASSMPLKLLVAPFLGADEKREGVIELFLTSQQDEASAATAAQALQEFCRLAVTERKEGEGPSPTVPSDIVNFSELCSQIHESLHVKDIAETVARQATFWTGCSRISVFEKRGRRCRLLAVSDLDEVDRRSRALRSMECAAGVIARGHQPVWIDGKRSPSFDAEQRQPEGVDAPDWMVGAIPLIGTDRSKERVIGLVWAEDYDEAGTWTDQRRLKLELVAAQASQAISNALRHREIPFLPLRVARAIFPKWLAAAIVLGAIAAGLVFIETDFDVTGRGTLRPRVQRDVYARVDGIVQQPLVEHGEPVAAGADLLRLRNPELEKERAELEGRIRTTEQQIADLEVLRARPERGEERGPRGQIELAARQAELVSILQNLQGQEVALSKYEQELNLTSPISGVVLTWDVEQLLEGRWVQAGQRLLTVADLDGPWIVEIRVPDRDIDHVLAAGAGVEGGKVTFVTATDLEETHTGVIVDVARAVEHDPLDGPVVVVTVEVENAAALKRQPGSSVYPRVHCGRQPLGYVWFRRLYETVVSWVAL